MIWNGIACKWYCSQWHVGLYFAQHGMCNDYYNRCNILKDEYYLICLQEFLMLKDRNMTDNEHSEQSIAVCLHHWVSNWGTEEDKKVLILFRNYFLSLHELKKSNCQKVYSCCTFGNNNIILLTTEMEVRLPFGVQWSLVTMIEWKLYSKLMYYPEILVTYR